MKNQNRGKIVLQIILQCPFILRIVMNDLKNYPYSIYFNMDLIKYKYVASTRQYHPQGMHDSRKGERGSYHTHD